MPGSDGPTLSPPAIMAEVGDAASLTDLIRRARDGDALAFESVFKLAYEDLRRLASARLRAGARDGLLDTTSLVHESYLRFVETRRPAGRRPQHTSCATPAASCARSSSTSCGERTAQRRGGDAVHVTLDTDIREGGAPGEEEILRVHEALEELERHDARMAQVVEMRYFGGHERDGDREALDVSPRTVRRDWEKARLLLVEALK